MLCFSDGSTSNADVVIGADGIRSVVRANMLSDAERVEPGWSGVTVYRALVPSNVLETRHIGEDHPIRNLARVVRHIMYCYATVRAEIGTDNLQYCGTGKHF